MVLKMAQKVCECLKTTRELFSPAQKSLPSSFHLNAGSQNICLLWPPEHPQKRLYSACFGCVWRWSGPFGYHERFSLCEASGTHLNDQCCWLCPRSSSHQHRSPEDAVSSCIVGASLSVFSLPLVSAQFSWQSQAGSEAGFREEHFDCYVFWRFIIC